MKLKLKQKAPQFKTVDQNGKLHELKEWQGKWLILYFYPKDDTPGCTKEACSFRDNFAKFKKKRIVVVGISADDKKTHKRFAKKYNLPFMLLADNKKEVIKKYNVWGKKTFMGHSYLGIKRTTFLIDPSGKVAKIYENVKPDDHALQIIEDLKQIKR